MKRISQLIAASARELTNGKRYPSRALVLNETTGELRRGPGTWDEMARYGIEVPVDLVIATVATANVGDAGLAAGQTVNGRELVAGDIVLRAAQSAGAENGLYVVPGEEEDLERHPDYDTLRKLAGVVVEVAHGTKEGALYLCTNSASGTIGTTTVDWAEHVGGSFRPALSVMDGNALFQVLNTDGTSKTVTASVMKAYFSAE